jgi:hypothetical protein
MARRLDESPGEVKPRRRGALHAGQSPQVLLLASYAERAAIRRLRTKRAGLFLDFTGKETGDASAYHRWHRGGQKPGYARNRLLRL